MVKRVIEELNHRNTNWS